MRSTRHKLALTIAGVQIAQQLLRARNIRTQRQHPIKTRAGSALARAERVRDVELRRPQIDLRKMSIRRRPPTARERVRNHPFVFATLLAALAAVGAGVFALLRPRLARQLAERTTEVVADPASTPGKATRAATAGATASLAASSDPIASTSDLAKPGLVAAGTQVVKDKVAEQVDEHMVEPARQKAIKFGAIGASALTAYLLVVVMAAVLLANVLL